MLSTTMRVKIGSKIYNKLIHCLEKQQQWSLHFNLWDIADIKRIERTDYVRVLLTRTKEQL